MCSPSTSFQNLHFELFALFVTFIEGLLPKDVQIHLENIERISQGKYTDTEWGRELGNYTKAWVDYTPAPPDFLR